MTFNPQFWWYLSRATGIVAWVLLAGAALWGMLLSTKAFPRHRRPAWLLDLHRWLGGLGLSFVVAHLGALVADSYLHFGVADLLVPFASSWRPGPALLEALALPLGVVALWLLVAIEVTSLGMRRLPRKAWRAVHLLSYAVLWTTALHAGLAGTDVASSLFRWTALATIVALCLALLYRVLRPGPGVANRPSRVRSSSGVEAPRAGSRSTAEGELSVHE